MERTPGMTSGVPGTGRPKEEPSWGQAGLGCRGPAPPERPHLPWCPLLLSGAPGGQPPGRDHTLRAVKTSGAGTALGNELTKSLSCEGPGAGSTNTTRLRVHSQAQRGWPRASPNLSL